MKRFRVMVVKDSALDLSKRLPRDYPDKSDWMSIGVYDSFTEACDKADDWHDAPNPVMIEEVRKV